ncbi:MAG: hypothetical protein ACK5P6_08205 [Pseudobdellovibrionaceae bacterium]
MKIVHLICFTIALALSAPHVLMGSRDSSLHGLSLRQLVDQEMHELRLNLKTKTHPFDRMRAIEQSRLKIQALRKSSPQQFLSDEGYLNRLEKSLARIPSRTEYRERDCRKVEQRLVSDLRRIPASEKSAVEEAIELVQMVCQVAL